ncbi:MAG: DUF1549 domain-containing protein, partial [Planctomycetota bacterium]
MFAFVRKLFRKCPRCPNDVALRRALIPAFVVICLVLPCSLNQCSVAFADTTSKDIAFFEAKIRPLLIEHCYECHSAQSGESSGDFRIDTAAAISRGGAAGPAINRDAPDESLLLEVIQYDGDIQMPPEGRLDDESIAAIGHWLELGAPDPRTESNESAAPASPLQRDPMEHWAYNVPKLAAPPEQHVDSSHDILDDLAAETAHARGIRFNQLASDESLIRRLYHDLSGLPPTRDQIDKFVNASQPDNYERLVDDLIASPAFGERFGRHWLDLARYADTIGYATAGKERVIKGSHRFRDWVIDALNENLPFDQFSTKQLAGDLLDDPTTQDLIASTYNRLIQTTHEGGLQLKEYRAIYMSDRVRNASQVWLGGTLGCAE